jgi:hypothetical protein
VIVMPTQTACCCGSCLSAYHVLVRRRCHAAAAPVRQCAALACRACFVPSAQVLAEGSCTVARAALHGLCSSPASDTACWKIALQAYD